METHYKTLNSVQTQLLTWGDPFDTEEQDVIVCVTGNPGVPDFYIEFASQLHLSTQLPVCVVGHAGHIEVPDEKSNVLENQEKLFNLEGQLQHKLDLINNCIYKKRKLHLIGHSIGAWMLAELTQKNEDLIGRIASVQFLFPTVQRMAESTNGKFLNVTIRKFHKIVMLFYLVIDLLPQFVKSSLISLYLKINSLPPHYSERILKYIKPTVNEKVLFLAYDEMDTVKTLNTSAIDKIKHLTNVIYGSKDGWAPVSYMEDFKIFQPSLKMKEVNIRHAFVLKSAEPVAELVSDFVKSKYIKRYSCDKCLDLNDHCHE